MGPLDNTTVTLIPDQLIMGQPVNMAIFIITDWSLKADTLGKGNKGIKMKLVMKRKIVSEMMTTYFPSLLLTAITFATTFFKPFFFEAALSVNLTTMLVMTTIFISKMEGLPPTSATKMIDYWLILCQLVPFTQVVLRTATEYLRDDHDQTKSLERKETLLETTNQLDSDEVKIEEPETQEAWNVPAPKISGESMIGKISGHTNTMVAILQVAGELFYISQMSSTAVIFLNFQKQKLCR